MVEHFAKKNAHFLSFLIDWSFSMMEKANWHSMTLSPNNEFYEWTCFMTHHISNVVSDWLIDHAVSWKKATGIAWHFFLYNEREVTAHDIAVQEVNNRGKVQVMYLSGRLPDTPAENQIIHLQKMTTSMEGVSYFSFRFKEME